MIPIVYRWDDTDAPVLSGTAGALVNLLTKCLVDGYGSKAGSGWTKNFENTEATIAAFQNSVANGNGVFLRVDDTGTTNATFTGFELMTDIDSTSGNFLPGTTYRTVNKSATANTTMRPWVLIATDKFFFIFIRGNDTTEMSLTPERTNMHCFGDFKNYKTDGFNSLIGFSSAIGYQRTGFGLPEPPIISPGCGLSSPRAISGVADVPQSLWMTYGGPASFKIASTDGSGTQLPIGEMYDGANLILTRPIIGDGGAANIRGWLPGFYVSCLHHESFSPLQTVTDSVTGRSFLHMKVDCCYAGIPEYYGPGGNCTIAAFLIDLGDWDD